MVVFGLFVVNWVGFLGRIEANMLALVLRLDISFDATVLMVYILTMETIITEYGKGHRKKLLPAMDHRVGDELQK